MIELSKRLKQLRIDRGIDKSQLITYLAITSRTYDRYEDGSRKPDIETLVKIADYYCCSLDVLVSRNYTEDFVDRSLVVSYRDLKELGLNDKIAHGLIKQVYDGYSAKKIPLVDSIKKLKFIYKKDLVSCLNDIMKNLEEKKYV
ncbi:TPA: helix-turn-helix transcriptional regulator [Streptococcus agalactiae]|nr:helix-turn-helix transcriptional regulator [Streptococcus agalactiae]